MSQPEKIEVSPELKHLVHIFLDKGFGILKHCQNEGIAEILPGLGMTVFRDKQMQIQLFMFRPNAVILEHAHPHVESVEVYLCGDMRLTLDGQEVFGYADCIDLPDGTCPKNGQMLYLKPGAIHGGSMGPRGGSFLSIQVWQDGYEPKPIHLDWHDPLGKINHG